MNTNNLPKEEKFIFDPLMDPYFIGMDEYNYILYKTAGKNRPKPIAFFSTINSILKRLIELKTNTFSNYNSFQEYIATYKSISTQILNLNTDDSNFH